MKTQIKNLPKSQKEITIEVSTEEMEKYMDKSAKKLSLENEISGFRKGKAPRNIIEQELGKQKVFAEAANIAIEDSYFNITNDNKLEPIGRPKAEIIKIALGNPFEYKFTISIMPEVKLGDYRKISGKLEVKNIRDERVEREIKTLQKKRASYITKDESAQKGDRVEIDFTSRMAGVKIESGESKNHPLIIGENKFVGGFEDNLIGMKKGNEKKFSLVFPQDYYKKELAGKNVYFEVEMKLVQKVNLPKIDDEFAKSLGRFENLENLKKNIKEGLEMEEEIKARKKLRSELINQVCKNTIVDIPDVLVDGETANMVNELKHNIESYGLKFDDYLANLKTDINKLKIEWRSEAEKRVKINLAIVEISKKEEIKASDEEIEKRASDILKYYPSEEEIRKNIDIEKFKDHIAFEIVNEKVFDFLEKIAEENGK